MPVMVTNMETPLPVDMIDTESARNFSSAWVTVKSPSLVGGEIMRLLDHLGAAMPAPETTGRAYLVGESGRLRDRTTATAPFVSAESSAFEEAFDLGWLDIAAQFDDLDEYAEETDCARPTDAARAVAVRLARAAHDRFPRRYSIYPTLEGGVAVQARIRKGAALLIDCEPDGGASILFGIDGRNRSAEYNPQSAESSPDAFFFDAVDELRREAESSA